MAVVEEHLADGEPAAVTLRAIAQLSEAVGYLPVHEAETLQRACFFAARAHGEQKRSSGEPYVTHPLAVAAILASWRLDGHTLCAAVLHDCLEDTAVTKKTLVDQFGSEIADLVDGVTKLSQINAKNKAEAQAENFRRMMLAVVKDIRVILIKLADRLHNMETIDALPIHKRHRIARETLSIYAPIANRLGMHALRMRLEELAFAAIYPLRARALRQALDKVRGSKKEIMRRVQNVLQERFAEAGLLVDLSGREKHLYSIYRKMKEKNIRFNEVHDVFAFRILAPTVDACYRVLGICHMAYRPVPGRFKDYIAIPKANGYQSLHTILSGVQGVSFEVQIRTPEMDLAAESGICAHWRYKDGEESAMAMPQRTREWLHNIIDMQIHAGTPQDFLESVKIDLFPDELYVFTPKGGILRLPQGATPVDFAYAVHTALGNACVAAKIDHRLAPLNTPLESGQTVEIITSPHGHPNPSWLNFVVTARARAKIRHHLRTLRAAEAQELGGRLVTRAFDSLELSDIPPVVLEATAAQMGYPSWEAVLQAIGLGETMAPLVARRVMEVSGSSPAQEIHPAAQAPLGIRGTEGMVVTFAKCCRPIPGDSIVGTFTRGKGIVIHTAQCRNLGEFRRQPERWIEVSWEGGLQRDFPAELRLEAINRRGVLAQLAAEISHLGANIEHMVVEERDEQISAMDFVLCVRDRVHLARIIKRLRAQPTVLRVMRPRG